MLVYLMSHTGMTFLWYVISPHCIYIKLQPECFLCAILIYFVTQSLDSFPPSGLFPSPYSFFFFIPPSILFFLLHVTFLS